MVVLILATSVFGYVRAFLRRLLMARSHRVSEHGASLASISDFGERMPKEEITLLSLGAGAVYAGRITAIHGRLRYHGRKAG